MNTLAILRSHPSPIIWWIVYVTPVLASIAALIWSVVMVRAWRRDLRRHRNGLCMHCGYDLRETRDRCPECGHPILERKFQSS